MLITRKERERLSQITAVAREGDGVKREDIVWVCELADRLARLKITEAEFHPHAALINEHRCTAIALGFVGTIPAEQLSTIPSVEAVEILNLTTESGVCDADLCVRPYIRIVEPKGDGMLDRLARLCRIRVDIGGGIIIENSPAEEHLVGPDGHGLRRHLFSFRLPAWAQKGDSIFKAGSLNLDTGDAIPTDRGIFLPTGATVKIWLSGLDLLRDETLQLSTGLVMGRYTTKDVPFVPTTVKTGAQA